MTWGDTYGSVGAMKGEVLLTTGGGRRGARGGYTTTRAHETRAHEREPSAIGGDG